MNYSIELYDMTENEINARRSRALNEYDRRLSGIRKNAPEIAKLCDSLSMTFEKLSKAILGGGSDMSKKVDEIRQQNLNTQETIKRLLVEFGYSEDYLDVPYTCKKCRDTGSVMGNRCDCFVELINKNAVAQLNAKSKITLHDFSEFNSEYYPADSAERFSPREQMKAVYKYCVDYASEFSESSPSLLLIGNTGLGKTFLSSAIAKRLTEKGFTVIFDSVQNLLREIENQHFGRSDGDTMELIQQADLVILDDLGSEFITNFNASALYNIINDRINMNKPIIISTNYSNAELNQKYNDRIISRISSFVPLRFEGKDIRQIILKNKY